MNKTLKQKWIKALRSGKYKQGERSLFDGRAHCCLGVLARIQGAVARKGTLKIGGEDVRKEDKVSRTPLEYLAPAFAGDLHSKTQSRLANMNDGSDTYFGKRRTFEQIADFIEKKL